MHLLCQYQSVFVSVTYCMNIEIKITTHTFFLRCSDLGRRHTQTGCRKGQRDELVVKEAIGRAVGVVTAIEAVRLVVWKLVGKTIGLVIGD
jgi:hypothetical protein